MMNKFIKNKDLFNNQALDFEMFLLIDKKYSKETIDSYLNDLYKYYLYLKKNNIVNVKKENIINYIDYLKKNKLSTTSINHNISVLRTFYKFILITYNLKENPMEFIESSKNKKSLPTVLSYEEIKSLLDIDLIDKYSYRNKAMLELMYATGLRVSELLNLKINDCDLDMGYLKTLGKGSKERIVPIGENAAYFLKKYLYNYRSQLLKKDNNEYLCLNNYGHKL